MPVRSLQSRTYDPAERYVMLGPDPKRIAIRVFGGADFAVELAQPDSEAAKPIQQLPAPFFVWNPIHEIGVVVEGAGQRGRKISRLNFHE